MIDRRDGLADVRRQRGPPRSEPILPVESNLHGAVGRDVHAQSICCSQAHGEVCQTQTDCNVGSVDFRTLASWSRDDSRTRCILVISLNRRDRRHGGKFEMGMRPRNRSQLAGGTTSQHPDRDRALEISATEMEKITDGPRSRWDGLAKLGSYDRIRNVTASCCPPSSRSIRNM